MAKAKPNTEKPMLTINTGLGEIVDLSGGYVPTHIDFRLPPAAGASIKRLALTLDVNEARLKDGTLVKNSPHRAVAWLCERFAESETAYVETSQSS